MSVDEDAFKLVRCMKQLFLLGWPKSSYFIGNIGKLNSFCGWYLTLIITLIAPRDRVETLQEGQEI